MDDFFSRLSRERGIGPTLGKRLIAQFGEDLGAMCAASREDLLGIQGLGPSRVHSVQQTLVLLRDLTGSPPQPGPKTPRPQAEIPRDGAPFFVKMPSVTVLGPESVRVQGLGLDLVVELGDAISLEAIWDGVEIDHEGSPKLRWERVDG